jgi:hypothetical protein
MASVKSNSIESRRQAYRDIDLRLQVFGRLTVLRFSFRKGGNRFWKCRCECGNEVDVKTGSLRSGNTRSCGCIAKEILSKRCTVHGLSHTDEHNIWKGIIRRCSNKNDKAYPKYGGAGVCVTQRWRGPEGFINFLSDMGKRPSLKHSIDRFPDHCGNYEPNNCRWATHFEQNRNRRSNIVLTIGNRTQCISDWAIERGIEPTIAMWRWHQGYRGDLLFVPPRFLPRLRK